MEAYVLYPMSSNWRREASREEQEEDIGCPSDSEMSATDSMLSSSGEELEDDATSSSSSSSSGSTESFEMSSLMAQLPLKRGLSKFFDGKSQSFASLAAVGGLEDLAKPPSSKRLKTSRSCEVGLQDAHRRRFASRNAAAFKKVSKGRLSVLGKAQANKLTLRPVTARPQGLPVRGALLFA
ncbi:protein OXIDATIVE STRESS 3 LIKE 2-like [Lolium rigidum]|uniref:protein OXIDATIVE STRESS 3 LIKE 2-like n=1 Tax=Lolium rigidum TaxID=89674 RepID=UPI001F5DC628|nr:protein OXIDATIVE STRESS 3 LIKE 2-like [Lolium rigidum]